MTPTLAADRAVASMRNVEQISTTSMRGVRWELPAEPIVDGLTITPALPGLNLEAGTCTGWDVLQRHSGKAVNQRRIRRLSEARQYARRLAALPYDWINDVGDLDEAEKAAQFFEDALHE